MTQEEKAKRYDEALERARKCLDEKRDTCFVRPDVIFPELKESEDEKIRKVQLDYWRSVGGKEWHGVPVQETIAWLEKQGKKESDPRYENLEELLAADDIYQMSMNDEMVQEAKEKAVNALSGMCIGRLLGVEKQDEQKPVYDFNAVDWQPSKVDGKIHNIYNSGVEPKFNGVGRTPIKITAFESDNGVISKVWFSNGTGTYIDFLKYYHLWSIADVRDGDILAASDGSVFIFKEVVANACKHYIALAEDNETIQVNDNLGHCWESVKGVRPATKEQRDLLFQKMKENNWEWDKDKKELKKIEAFPILSNSSKTGKKWTEEDSLMIDSVIDTIKWLKGRGATDMKIDWLKSLKQRMEQQ